MAKLAVILCEASPGPRELRLGRILDFFGVPWIRVNASKLGDLGSNSSEYAVFGTVNTITTFLRVIQGTTPPVFRADAFYAFLDDERSLSLSALQSLFGDPNLSLQDAPAGNISLHVSDREPDMAGPTAGLNLSLRLGSEDAVLTGLPVGEESKFTKIISVGDHSVFVRFQHDGIPIFFCASSQMVDIDKPITRGFYDVKDHFCSAVPLVMFIRSLFPEVAWRPQELGACLIIDDPLLKNRYGFCDFQKLRNLMRGHSFTTDIAFIPWNWRRTSHAASKFFRSESDLFSVSIHGCDHTGGEFGTSSREVLHTKAQLALSRMLKHKARTGIEHDSIMVFPQGVFSSECPEVLKQNGFLAAVNTELVPVDTQNSRTRISDVWDAAIMTYGDFPIFTRRYAFHGIENFAFDLLLGKPCLIVAHHDNFKDGGATIIELIEKIGSLNCSLKWRPLGDVIRRACRRRVNGSGGGEVEMYSNELVIENSSDRAIEVRIRKRKGQKDDVSEILTDDNPTKWSTEDGYLFFGDQICSRSEKRIRVSYRQQPGIGEMHRSLLTETAVATRRLLSEFRDDCLSRSPFLSVFANKLNSMLKKAI